MNRRTSAIFNSYVVRTKRNRQGVSADVPNSDNYLKEGHDPLLQEGLRNLSVQDEQEEWPYLAPINARNSDDEREDDNEENDTDVVENSNPPLSTSHGGSSNDHVNSADAQIETQNNTSSGVPTVSNIYNISSNEPYIIHVLQSGLKYAASWSSLVSFLSTHGRTRFPKELYQIYNETIMTSSDNNQKLLSYSTTRQGQSNYFNSHCFPKSTIFHFPCLNLIKRPRSPTLR